MFLASELGGLHRALFLLRQNIRGSSISFDLAWLISSNLRAVFLYTFMLKHIKINLQNVFRVASEINNVYCSLLRQTVSVIEIEAAPNALKNNIWWQTRANTYKNLARIAANKRCWYSYDLLFREYKKNWYKTILKGLIFILLFFA